MNFIQRYEARLWLGIFAIVLTGVIHLIEMPEYLEEQRYIGVLFGLAALGSLLAAFGIYRGASWGWNLGLAVAGGSAIAFVASRTIGLPRFREASWESFLEPMGIASLFVEIVFVILAFTDTLKSTRASSSRFVTTV